MSDKGKLSHLEPGGTAHMVDVGMKDSSARWARARAEVLMTDAAFETARQGNAKKGDVLSVAQLAGIMAAKKTSDLIPLCHPLPLDQIEVELTWDDSLPGLVITATVRTSAKTGVEMEALTAVSVAALTVYDMVKSVEHGLKIQNIRLLEKHGGRSGDLVLEES